jgi:thiol-disulfide isomerase/thioredoxin
MKCHIGPQEGHRAYPKHHMSPLVASGALLGIVVLATLLGLVWRARNGRVRSADGERITPSELGEDGSLGARATFVQFSTEYCAPCKATHRLLSSVADRNDGIRHLDVDLTNRVDLAARFNVLQTPTTLILDKHGIQRARIAGAPRAAELIAAVNRIVEGERVQSA